MIPFAAHLEGEPEDTGHWVLAVDGDRLLLAREDRTLHWVDVDKCTFLKMVNPEVTSVIPVKAAGRPSLVVPGVAPNGAS